MIEKTLFVWDETEPIPHFDFYYPWAKVSFFSGRTPPTNGALIALDTVDDPDPRAKITAQLLSPIQRVLGQIRDLRNER